jgi:hypothetical protein
MPKAAENPSPRSCRLLSSKVVYLRVYARICMSMRKREYFYNILLAHLSILCDAVPRCKSMRLILNATRFSAPDCGAGSVFRHGSHPGDLREIPARPRSSPNSPRSVGNVGRDEAQRQSVTPSTVIPQRPTLGTPPFPPFAPVQDPLFSRRAPPNPVQKSAKRCKKVQNRAIGSRRGLAEPMILSPPSFCLWPRPFRPFPPVQDPAVFPARAAKTAKNATNRDKSRQIATSGMSSHHHRTDFGPILDRFASIPARRPLAMAYCFCSLAMRVSARWEPLRSLRFLLFKTPAVFPARALEVVTKGAKSGQPSTFNLQPLRPASFPGAFFPESGLIRQD